MVSAFVIPSAAGVLKGNALTTGGILVEQALTQARQLALTKNHRIELRFLSYIDPSSAISDARIQGVQIYEIDDNGTVLPVGRLQHLPEGIAVNTSSSLSNLISDASRQKSFGSSKDPKSPLPGNISNYSATYVQFLPDGSTDLSTSGGGDSGKWYLTLQASTDNISSATVPKNFITIQVDPVSGTLKSLRP